eukprot:1925446-Amphidinium_carterae.1
MTQGHLPFPAPAFRAACFRVTPQTRESSFGKTQDHQASHQNRMRSIGRDETKMEHAMSKRRTVPKASSEKERSRMSWHPQYIASSDCRRRRAVRNSTLAPPWT